MLMTTVFLMFRASSRSPLCFHLSDRAAARQPYNHAHPHHLLLLTTAQCQARMGVGRDKGTMAGQHDAHSNAWAFLSPHTGVSSNKQAIIARLDSSLHSCLLWLRDGSTMHPVSCPSSSTHPSSHRTHFRVQPPFSPTRWQSTKPRATSSKL